MAEISLRALRIAASLNAGHPALRCPACDFAGAGQARKLGGCSNSGLCRTYRPTSFPPGRECSPIARHIGQPVQPRKNWWQVLAIRFHKWESNPPRPISRAQSIGIAKMISCTNWRLRLNYAQAVPNRVHPFGWWLRNHQTEKDRNKLAIA